ncbi:SET and MYND domain-containing protein 4-like [Acanthaster planci]|uniref:SET and MYND domain-containing protein 4-like n=1 Tax=Acanthaster planci TaxID=133434 RepID=A0A8B7Y3H6_ACAPL|nr:SET and MYND domain-containing protein 4-like [Acanthaster planci]
MEPSLGHLGFIQLKNAIASTEMPIHYFSCPQCTDVQYCSDQCMRSAQESHHWLECGLWDGLNMLGTQAWLSLRLLLQAKSWHNAKYIAEMASSRVYENEVERTDGSSPAGCGQDGCYHGDYQAVYHLVPHAKNHSEEQLFNMTMTALLLSKCIQKKLDHSREWMQHTDTSQVSSTVTAFRELGNTEENKPTDVNESQNEESAKHLSSCCKQSKLSKDSQDCMCKREEKCACGDPSYNRLNEHDPSMVHEIAAFLLRHLQQLTCNSHAVTTIQKTEDLNSLSNMDKELKPTNSRLRNSDASVRSGTTNRSVEVDPPVNTRVDKWCDREQDTMVDTTKQARLATAVYPTASLLNHSCQPNTIASFDGAILTMRATRDIQPGEEILHCYGPHAKHMSRDERQKALQEQYFFTCTCHACTVTPVDEMETCDWSNSFACCKCSHPLMQREGKRKVGVCINPDCRHKQSLRDVLKEKERAGNLFKLSQHFLECKHIEECLGILHQCYNVQRDILYKHHKALAETQDFLAKCYSCMGDYKTAGKYLRLSIATVEKQYGQDSIELANELHKLAQVLFNGGEVQDTLVILDRAIKLLVLHYGPNHRDVQELSRMKTCLPSL